MRNFEVRITEHSNICHTSEPARHLLENPSHSSQWRVLCSARSYFKREIIEGLIIQQRSPTLNKRVNCCVAQLFPSGITLSIKTMQITKGLFNPDDDLHVENVWFLLIKEDCFKPLLVQWVTLLKPAAYFKFY